MAKSTVLIASNPLDHEGGVVSYFRVMLAQFESNTISLSHISFGSRMQHFYSNWKKAALYPLYYIVDYFRFLRVLATDQSVAIVQVNPSLIPVPLFRDAWILLSAKLLRRRTVVFFRGWKEGVVKLLQTNWLARKLFRFVYGRADATLVLASRFREELIDLGFEPSSITTTTTVYDASEILPPVDRAGRPPRLLFLGRISQLKGIDELIDAAKILDGRGVEFDCVLVGHEDRKGVIDSYRSRVRELGLKARLEFVGRLTGRKKFETYANADVFVLPSWTEGCPNSVLEALGSGLYIVSTDVGALRDIVSEGFNGTTVAPRDSVQLADALEVACKDVEKLRRRKSKIQADAASRFEAKLVFSKIEDFYKSLIYG